MAGEVDDAKAVAFAVTQASDSNRTDIARDKTVQSGDSATLQSGDVAREASVAGGDVASEASQSGDVARQPTMRSSDPVVFKGGETAASGSLPASREGPRDLPEVPDDRYSIGPEVGRGGLGRVLSARDEVLDRPVALKQLFATDDSSRRRFIREALITARLQHPAIIPVYDAGRRSDRSPFYAMKLVAGRPLDAAIAGAKTLAARLALLPQVLAVCDAVAYAHSQRIIHRDLKPGNVLVGEFGETIVIDWGLAKDLSIDDRDALDAGPYRASASTHTVVGAVLGTPGYMAPEQASGQEADERADVYALGAILYHVVSGKIPHEGTTLDEVIDKAIAAEVKPLREREPESPPDLVAIVDKAMAKHPAARYPSARELAEDLRRFQTGQLVGAHHYTLAQRVRRWIRKHRAVSAVAAIAIVVLAVIGTWSVRRVMAERDRAVTNANRAIIAQARMTMEHDPAAALAWLRKLDAGGSEWRAARLIAADALNQPLPDLLLHGTYAAMATPDGRYALGYTSGGLWVSELTANATPVELPVGRSRYGSALEVCDDSKRGLVLTSESDDGVIILVDLVGKRAETKPFDEQTWNDELVRCVARYRLSTKAERGRPPGIRWIDAKTGEDRLLAGFGFLGAWLAGDNQHVVAIDDQGAFHRFDVATGEEEVMEHAFEIGNDAKAPAHAAMSRDGTVAVARLGGKITYCDIGVHKICMPMDGTPEESERSIVVAPDGSWARGRTRERGGWFLQRDWAVPGGRNLPPGELYATADSKWLLAYREGKLVAVDVVSDVTRPLLGHAEVTGVQALPDGRVFTSGSDGTVRVSSLGTTAFARSLGQNVDAQFSPASSWLVVEGSEEALLRREIASGRTEMLPGYNQMRDRPMPAVNDAGRVARVSRNGAVSVYEDKGTWRELGVHDGAHVVDLRMLNSGKPLTVGEHAIAIWEGSGARYIKVAEAIPVRGDPMLQIDRGERRAQVACGEHRCVVDLQSGRVDVLAEAVGRGAMSDDGRVMITGGAKGEYLVWDLDSLRVRRRFAAIDAMTGVKGLSRDGRRAAVGTERGVELVDLETGASIPLRSREPQLIQSVVFAPDGRSLTDLSWLWDAATGEGRDIAPGGRTIAVEPLDDRIVVVTLDGIEVIPDDLPRDPAQLAARLRSLPYRLDEYDRLVVDRH